ncbi:hypothetical protein GW17_00017804 [Ensete ventricosum]|nr:hypothetical protein GW17_00017804 [Ensete ventricosum]
MLPCTWETRHTGGFREVWPTAIKRRIAIVDPPTSGKVTADVNQPTRPVLTSPRALLPREKKGAEKKKRKARSEPEMGKLLSNSAAVAETLNPSPSLLQWPDPDPIHTPEAADPATVAFAWAAVSGLDEQQRRRLEKIHARGVFWKNPGDAEDPGVAFRLEHGGDVEADGNCLFTAARRAMGPKTAGARELRQRAVQRFLEDYGSADGAAREAVDVAIRHLYSPDLKAGWGIHVVQEVKLLAKKADREGLDAAIQELVDLGLQRYNIIAFSFLFN